jgi:lipopolysaccharide transport system permease protein
VNQPHLPEVVYEPGETQGQGMYVWIEMMRDVWRARELLAQFIFRDITVRYRQSLLGYGWALIPPVALALLFAFLARERVIPIGTLPAPYIPFALFNLAVWNLFAGCITAGTDSLLRAGALVTKANFPKELLVVAVAGPALFDFGVRLIPVAVVFIWFDIEASLAWLLVPLLLVPILLLALGLGFLFSVVNLVLRDVGQMVGMAMTFGLFLTPVLYPPPVREPFLLVNLCNPVSPLLIAIQDLAFAEAIREPVLWAAYALTALMIFMVGWRTFHLVLPRVVERA